jgi:hypothetical protein
VAKGRLFTLGISGVLRKHDQNENLVQGNLIGTRSAGMCIRTGPMHPTPIDILVRFAGCVSDVKIQRHWF